MRAATYKQYGGPEVINIQELENPTPNENQILIKVKASTVTAGDAVLRAGEPFASRLVTGIKKPKNPILGHEYAGEVIETGSSVTKFKVGDRVFGSLGLNAGSHAEYLTVSEDSVITHIPEGIDFETAASVPVGGVTALFFLRKANIKNGDKVLINGASGSVGSYAVQIAKYFGAEVTAVSGPDNIALVKSLGADLVINYRVEDFAQNSKQYDIIFDAVGKRNYNEVKSSIKDSGMFVTTAVRPSLLIQMTQTSITGKKRVFSGMVKEDVSELKFLSKLLENGDIVPVVHDTIPLPQIKIAHEIVARGHKRGNIIITNN